MDNQMKLFEEGGLYQEGGTTDPVSGNEVPAGSLQEEVRDDIPAQLSEGEFVFPADVVRYIGLENLMELRQKAKSGLQKMDDMGQMGNSEEAVMSDDGVYDDEIDRLIDEMDMDQGQPQEFQIGGLVGYPQGAPAGGGFLPYGVAPPQQMQGVAAPQLGAASGMMPSYETKAYIGPDGDIRYITFLNGQPLVPIPEGYTEYTPATTPVVSEQPTTPVTEDRGGDDGGGAQTEPVRRTIGNQFGFSEEEIPRALSFVPGLGPVVALARGAQNINNAAAVNEARKAVGLPELSFEDYVKAAFTGEYDSGAIGRTDIGGRDYTVGFGGRVLEPEQEGMPAVTTLSVAEAQRRQQLAAQQAGRPFEDVMSAMTAAPTSAQTTVSPSVSSVAGQLGAQLEEGVQMKESREIQKTLDEQRQAAEQARATAEDLKSQYETLQSESSRQAAEFAEQVAKQQESIADSLQRAQESQQAAEQARQSAAELREQYDIFRTDTLAEQAQFAETIAEQKARIAEYDQRMADLVTRGELDTRISEIPTVAPVSPVEVVQAFPERDLMDQAQDQEEGRVMREAEAAAQAARTITPTQSSRPVSPGESVTYTDRSGDEQTVTGKSYTDASGQERAGAFVDDNKDGQQQSNERSAVTSSDGSAVRSGDGSVVTSRSQDEIDRDSGGGGGGGGGCVIATHGIQTGGFTLREKATAELYCMKNFHGTWWGEAFRRGYRYVGMQHIKNGTAESVYQEFKDFVKTGRGLKKDIVSKMKWLSRVVQFIIVGLTIARK